MIPRSQDLVSHSEMKGLTLLEVLVSVFIMAIIMGAIYSTYTSSVRVIQNARQRGQVYQMTRTVFDRITKDLESAIISIDTPHENTRLGLVGKDQESDGKPTDSLNFTTLGHLPLSDEKPWTDLCEVGYQLEKDPENEGHILYRRDDAIPDDDITDGGFSHELARRVAGLDFIYQDKHGEEFDGWNTMKGKPGSSLPTLITVKLTIIDEQAREHLFTTSIHPFLADKREQG